MSNGNTPGYPDFEALIDSTGAVPAVMAAYMESKVEGATGLQPSISLVFRDILGNSQVRDAARYCGAVFNAFGYKVDEFPDGTPSHIQTDDYVGLTTSLRFSFKPQDVPQHDVVVDKRQVDFEMRDVIEPRPVIGAQWFSLRTIRLAAERAKAGNLAPA